MLRLAIDSMGRSQTELAELLGSRSRASEIRNRKRGLNLKQGRPIGVARKLPLDVLAVPYRLDGEAA